MLPSAMSRLTLTPRLWAGLVVEGAGWFAFLLAFSTRSISIRFFGLVTLGIASILGLLMGVHRSTQLGSPAHGRGQVSVAIIVGSISLIIVAILLILILAFPINLFLFNCLGSPDSWSCITRR